MTSAPLSSPLPLEKPIAKVSASAVSGALKLACRQRIAQCVDIYRRAGIALRTPTVSFDLRGKTAGKAYYLKDHVQLNPVLLQENQQAFIDDTVGHEVAHLATFARHGRAASAHGLEWQRMMRLIGQEPRRCHSFDTSNSAVSKQTYRYLCGCREHMLSARKHGTARSRGYSCRRCGQPLKYAPGGSGAPMPGSVPRPLAPVTPRASMSPPVAPRFVTAGRPPSPPSVRPPPVRPPTPVSPPVARPAVGPATAPVSGLRPPSVAMVRFAQDLALKLGQSVPAAVLASFDQTSAFISAAKAQLERQTSEATMPSQKQLDYARHLSAKTGREVPPAALRDKSLLSRWLSQTLEQLGQGRP